MPYKNANTRRKKDTEYQRKARLRYRKFVRDIKVAKGCARCPERHPACLQFHHRNPKTKKFSIQKAVTLRIPRKVLLREIKKCDVLCANCHAKEHYRGDE